MSQQDSSSDVRMETCTVQGILKPAGQDSQVSSRSSSSESTTDDNFLTDSRLPAPMKEFFQTVSQEGYPRITGKAVKKQPWKVFWDGPQQPSKDGKLIVASPQQCAYGSNKLGGY